MPLWFAQVGELIQTVGFGLNALMSSAPILKAPVPPGACAVAARPEADHVTVPAKEQSLHAGGINRVTGYGQIAFALLRSQ